MNRCEHDGCKEEGDPCFLPDSDEPDAYYCAVHAFKHGFCAGCGEFNAGIESFDFSRNHLCENCQGNDDGDPLEDEDFDPDYL